MRAKRRQKIGTLRAQSRLAFCFSTPQKRDAAWEEYMATVSDSSRTTDRPITDLEFEQLLQKTYEMVQNQKSIHPLEPSAESTSWT